ncbi:helix-turn-helix domain-containing protein [Paenibacillus mesophilus]|uniref:AraC family transcriptional regulator n=1 Tax=Paenibacillus mesophilus TaxID=2582849 RepID=UPI00110E8876|nr:AraC family transcriptional regulator [Paenibacillus mesophilus]TMV50170.1 helix-turn-helix domain-containing protein [Paenibacillus mesophilus]
MTNRRVPFTLFGSFYWKPDFPIFVSRSRELFSLPIHVHDFIEINYVAAGKGYHYIGDNRLEVGRGDLFIIPIGTRHVYRPESTNPDHELIVYNCLFSQELLPRLADVQPLPFRPELLLSGETHTYRHFEDRNNECHRTLESMIQEYTLRMPGYEAMVCSLLLQLLVTLHRYDAGFVGSESKSSLSPLRLEPVFDYIAEHYSEAITLERLASLIPVSASYLQRMFKRTTGQSCTEYIQNVRIAKSCELLQSSSITVRDVALQVGYKDLKFFHTLFRKKTGTSPYRYKKKALSSLS